MALGCSGSMVFARGAQTFGATAFNSAIPHALQSNFMQTNRQRNITAGEGITSELVGLPSGYRHPGAWMMPQKGGALAARNTTAITFSPSGTAVGGITTAGTSSITFAVSDAAGQLISSGSGSASLTFTLADALLTASVGGTGSAAFTVTGDTSLLGAIASGDGTASFAIAGSLTPYAIGSMVGTTAVATTTVDANIVSVNGYMVTGNGQTGSEWGPA